MYKSTVGDTGWFTQARFGMFIHWGLYALPARHEWVKQREEIPDEIYQRYFKHFDPDLYDPALWADAAADAGMKYFVITTKHHEGFCLWDSAYTDYKATNTPAGRDLLRPMVDAFRARDLRVGFYHSVIDWHHPQFVIDDIHAQRNHPQRAEWNATRNQELYKEYLHNQVRELLTGFGRVDVLFFDFSYPAGRWGRGADWIGKSRNDWDSERLLAMVRELQPGIVVNDRLDLDDVEGGWDIKTPEQYMVREPVQVKGEPVVWETCQTFSGSWGYHRDETTWKSVEQLLLLLVDSVSNNGNLLLNVGPTGRGEFDERALDRLQSMGAWMRRHGRSIYGCGAAPEGLVAPQDCRLTYNPKTNRVYVHVFAWPLGQLALDGFKGKVEYAQLLNDASEIKMHEPRLHDEAYEVGQDRNTLVLELPMRKPNVPVPVIELFMR
ncbi:MAG: alpha-L-fucosidase [Anaerolineae bacterium]